jgi:hypothetical protein
MDRGVRYHKSASRDRRQERRADIPDKMRAAKLV